jgi:hypothetical protein
MLDVRCSVVLACVVLSGASFAQSRTTSATLGEVYEYPTTGCNGAVVQAPTHDRPFVERSSEVPPEAAAFYERAARAGAIWLTHLDCTPTNRTHVLKVDPAESQRPAGRVINGIASRNWAGYQIYSTAQFAQSGWTVPTVVRPMPTYSSTYYSSAWVGIGGGFGTDVNAPLIQAGSEHDLINGAAHYYLWYEVFGGSANTTGALKIGLQARPGDNVGSVVIWQPSAPGSTVGTVTLGLCNFSASPATCANIYLAKGTSTQPYSQQPGKSVEWIVERPYISDANGAGYSALADFDLVSFVGDCWAPVYQSGATCQKISAGNSPTPIDLYEVISNVSRHMATPGLLNADGTFAVAYLWGQQ